MAGYNVPLALGSVLAGSAYKTVKGIQQTRKGKKLLNTSRPIQEIPQAITDNYNAARFNAGTNSTAQEQAALNAIDENAAQTTGALTQAATDSSGLLASLTAASKAKNNAIIQAGDAAVRTHQQDLNTMIGTGNTYANEVNSAWDWNKKQPYQDAMLAASSLIKAGEENKFSALNDVATLGVGAAFGQFGGKGTDTTTPETDATIPQTADYTTQNNTSPAGSPFTSATGAGAMTQSYMGGNNIVQARQAYASGTATQEQISLLKANGLI